jgi:hypothetical protein
MSRSKNVFKRKYINKKFAEYEVAEKYIQSLKFRSIQDYKAWLKYKVNGGKHYVNKNGKVCPPRPSWICSNPVEVYGSKLKSMSHYVLGRAHRGKAPPKRELVTYHEASKYVQQFQFSNLQDYGRWCSHSAQQLEGGTNYINFNGIECPKKPKNIPYNPRYAYHKQYKGDIDYLLGPNFLRKYHVRFTKNKFHVFYKYKVAKAFLKPLNFKDAEDFYLWLRYDKNTNLLDPPYINKNGVECPRRPAFIPYYTRYTYWKLWVNIVDYLSLPVSEYKEYLEKYEKRKQKVRKEYSDRKSFHDEYLLYDDARLYLKQFKIESPSAFYTFYKKYRATCYQTDTGELLPPIRGLIPTEPKVFYGRTNDWVSWEDFLSIEHNPHKEQIINYLITIPSVKRFPTKASWRETVQKYDLSSTQIVKDLYLTGKWYGWDNFLHLYNNKRYCTYEEAKTYLSFKEFTRPSEYSRWRKENDIFFLPPLVSIDKIYENATTEDFLVYSFADKLHYRMEAVPVLTVIINQDGTISIKQTKAGKFEAFLLYGTMDNARTYDVQNTDMFDSIIRKHCTKNMNGQLLPYNASQLISELSVTFKTIIYANLFD